MFLCPKNIFSVAFMLLLILLWTQICIDNAYLTFFDPELSISVYFALDDSEWP